MAFRDAFKEFPTIETQRLILRNLSPDDAEAYHQQQRSALDLPGRPPWTYGAETLSADMARAIFHYSYNRWKKKLQIKWAICLKSEGGALIGQIEIMDITSQTKAELGYWLGAVYHNQGLMSEAVKAVVSYAFHTMGMHRLYAKTSTQNAPSIAMLKKVGFIQEGILRQDSNRDGIWHDTALMGIIKSDLLP